MSLLCLLLVGLASCSLAYSFACFACYFVCSHTWRLHVASTMKEAPLSLCRKAPCVRCLCILAALRSPAKSLAFSGLNANHSMYHGLAAKTLAPQAFRSLSLSLYIYIYIYIIAASDQICSTNTVDSATQERVLIPAFRLNGAR